MGRPRYNQCMPLGVSVLVNASKYNINPSAFDGKTPLATYEVDITFST